MKKTLICTLISLACGTAYADNVFQLGQIEVIASESQLMNNTVEQEQLQKLQINNIAQSAKLLPGVYFERKGGRAEQNMLVRGFDARRVPVLIDGIPVYVPYDGNMDLGRFTHLDLSQITVAKGSSSILYGPNALGGAINLVTQKPTKELEGTLGYQFQTGRNNKTASHNLYFNLGTKQEKYYIQLSGNLLNKQGLQLSKHYQPSVHSDEDGNRAENSRNEDKKLSLKLAYTPNNTDEYSLSLTTQKGYKQQPFYAGDNADAVHKYWIWPTWNKDSIYFLSHTEFNQNRFYFNGKLFFDTFKNDLSAYDDETLSTQKAKSTFNSHYRDYSYGAGFEFGAKVTDKNSLKLTALYKFDQHKDHDDGQPEARSQDRTYSLGLENTYAFNDSTKLITGVSFDRREALKAQSYQSDVKGIYDYQVADKNAFNYQIKLSHKFDSNDELSISAAHKTRFPTMKDRYSRSLSKYRTPNPFLKPERANHYELSYYRTFADKVRLEGALFYSEVKDAITEIYTGNSKQEIKKGKKRTIYETMNQNQGKEVYKGLELAITAFVNDQLTVGANYTYIKAKNNNGDHIRDIPTHKFFAYLDWAITPELSFYLSQSAEKGRYTLTKDGAKKLSGFGVTDVKFNYKVTNNFNIDIGVSNLFDKNYAYTEGYPEEGRMYFANLKYKF
ncbi:TonB-dependent receptor plug domain-containing protein [Pasteurellaceae bacterium 22721_9_1]